MIRAEVVRFHVRYPVNVILWQMPTADHAPSVTANPARNEIHTFRAGYLARAATGL